MGEFRSRIAFSLLIAALVAVATISMVVDRRARLTGGSLLPGWTRVVLDAAVPLQKMVALPFDVARDAWTRYVALVDVADQNQALRSQLAELREDNLQLREALVASGRLERIAEMRDDFDVPMRPAELVGVDVSPWFRSVLLDRGQTDGVLSGMPVISEDGLVGLVTATSSRAAKGMTVLDRQSAVDATVQRSRSRGIVRGRGSEGIAFEFVARGADVVVGDLVITSGLGGVYPKGLRIGRVTAVSDPGAKLVQTATPGARGRLREARAGVRDPAPRPDHGAPLPGRGRGRRARAAGLVKRVLGLLGLGAVALTLQGAVASFLPARFCPDLGFLLVVALGLCWRSAVGGVCVAGAIGYTTDLLSGSLLGQHALLRLAAYAVARFGNRHLNLRGALPQAVFVAVLTCANAFAMALLTSFFSPGTRGRDGRAPRAAAAGRRQRPVRAADRAGHRAHRRQAG